MFSQIFATVTETVRVEASFLPYSYMVEHNGSSMHTDNLAEAQAHAGEINRQIVKEILDRP